MPIPWNEVWQVVLAIAAGIVTLTAASGALTKLFNPYKQLVKRVEELQKENEGIRQDIKRHNELFARDLERFERNEAVDTMTIEALFAILKHARTNNSTGLMDTTLEKLEGFLIKKK